MPVLAAIVAALVVLGGFGVAYAYADNDISDKIARAQYLSNEGNHTEAIKLLEVTQRSWPVDSIGVKEAALIKELEQARLRKQHQEIYLQALDKLKATEADDGITLLQEIPDNSFYYHMAIQKIVEEELDAERAARQLAEQVATQEEQARKVAEQVAEQEREARKQAEQAAARGEEARQVAEQKARDQVIKRVREEAARREAEQRVAEERLARQQQQREAEYQMTLAEAQERARVSEIARANPLIKSVISGELKFYIEPLPPYAGTGVSNAVDSVARNFSTWNPYGASIRRVDNSRDADLTVSWVRDYGSEVLGQSIVRVHIKVGLGRNNCKGEWRAFDADTVNKILWHEIGHSMGYGHSTNPNNVMYYQTTTRFEVEQEISEMIPAGYAYTFPLCDSGTYSYSFESENEKAGFDIFVIPPGADSKNISTGGGRVYTGCGKENMLSYSGSCNVDSGARIYIANKSSSAALPMEGQIINRTNPPWPDMTWDQTEFQYDSAMLMRYKELFQ